jgi:hypothetical protein
MMLTCVYRPPENSSNVAARNGEYLSACVDIVQAERGDRAALLQPVNEEFTMSREDDNKAIVGRWFTDFWGKSCNLDIVDELAAPDMLLRYSLHEPRRGREDIKAFMTDTSAKRSRISTSGALLISSPRATM